MRSSVVEGRARAGGRARASMAPDREDVLRVAAELLDPVLLAVGFQRGSPGHWTGTRFAWHEDVLVDVVRPSSGRGPIALTVEIFAGVPRRGIGDPVPGTPLVRALDPPAREAMRRRSDLPGPDDGADHPGEDSRMRVTDASDLRTWLAFVAEHLPAAIARVRDHVL